MTNPNPQQPLSLSSLPLKEYLSIFLSVSSVIGLFFQGGRMIERLESLDSNVTTVVNRVAKLEEKFFIMQGTDSVQTVHIEALRRDVNNLILINQNKLVSRK